MKFLCYLGFKITTPYSIMLLETESQCTYFIPFKHLQIHIGSKDNGRSHLKKIVWDNKCLTQKNNKDISFIWLGFKVYRKTSRNGLQDSMLQNIRMCTQRKGKTQVNISLCFTQAKLEALDTKWRVLLQQNYIHNFNISILRTLPRVDG